MCNQINVIDREMPERVNDFFKYLQTVKKKSINTINGYKIDLRMFFKFIKAQRLKIDSIDDIDDISDIDDKFLQSITLSDLHNFLYFLEVEKNNSEATRNRKNSTLTSFFNYLEDKLEIIEKNPTKKLEKAKVVKREPVYLTIDEAKTLLNSVDKEVNNGIRDYCILTILLNCGLRREEVSELKLNSIGHDEVLTVIGKGNKERFVPLNKACIKVLNEWIEERSNLSIKKEDKDYLFISQKGCKMDKKSIGSVVSKYAEMCGFDKHISCHKLRHSYASILIESGVDVRVIQELLGHESLSTTQLYTHLNKNKLKDAVNMNPLGDL